MVAAIANGRTVFAVLGEAARHRSTRSLAAQLALLSVLAATVLIAAPNWWPLAVLVMGPATYACWGLLARMRTENRTAATLLAGLASLVAVVGTFATLAGIIGLWLALYTGTGRSPYDPCGPGASSRYCRALEHPAKGWALIP